MNKAYLDKWSELTQSLHEPWQAMMTLNLQTLQEMDVFKPEQAINIKKPEQLLEKQLEIAISNGHKAVEYMQKSLDIFEKTMTTLIQANKNTVGTNK